MTFTDEELRDIRYGLYLLRTDHIPLVPFSKDPRAPKPVRDNLRKIEDRITVELYEKGFVG